MAVDDAQMSWIRKRLYLNCYDLNAYVEATDTMGCIDATVIPVAVGTGLVGALIATDGDIIQGGFILPYDLDPKFEIGFRVHYSATYGSGVATLEFILLYDIIDNAARVDQVATTALDTVVGVHTFSGTVDLSKQRSGRGIALAATHSINRDQIEAGSVFLISLEQQASANLTNEAFIALEMDYAVQKCGGIGSENDNPLTVKDYL